MEVQLLVYIRRYRKHFTSYLGQIVIKSSNRYSTGGSFNFLNTKGTLFEKKNVSEYLKAWSWYHTYKKEKKPTVIHLKTAIYSLIDHSYIAILVTERLIIYSIIIKFFFWGLDSELNIWNHPLLINCGCRWLISVQYVTIEHPLPIVKQFTSLVVLKWHGWSLKNRRW